jgi:hypothetical protein
MTGQLLLSTAYLPPVQYISLLSDAEEILIEKEENYIKQTYRNRCIILSANGLLTLSVPVKRGSIHKTQIKDIEIDYSKRWQSVHLMAIKSAYQSSAFFEYYYERVENVILNNHRFLLDLNMNALHEILEIMKMKSKVTYTSHFEPVSKGMHDYRYQINPKSQKNKSVFNGKKYFQLFPGETGFLPNLSIIDLIFNTGPYAVNFL